MKVLYVVSSTQVIGGGSKSFLNLLYGVMNYGIDPLVVCPDRGMMYQNLQKQGIKVANCFYRYITYPPFNKNAKNGIFMFDRNYMDYHSDRFRDNSLLFYNEDELEIEERTYSLPEETLHIICRFGFDG